MGKQSGQPTVSSDEYLELQMRLDKLVMINMAIWSLLKEHSPPTEEDLLNRIKEIDLSDGKLDGKVRSSVKVCPQCNRTLSQKHQRCLYCGLNVQSNDAFGTVTR